MIPSRQLKFGQASRRGFSVLELLVSAALLVVIMLGLLAMFYQTERAFRIGIAQTDILEGGRSTLELLVDDLGEMHATELFLETNFAAYFGYPGVLQPLSATPGDHRYNLMQPFYFLTRQNDTWRGVRYDFDPAQTAGGAGTLYRLDLIPGVSSPNLTNDPVLLSRLLSEETFFVSTNYGRIVDGVVHLSVRAYDALGNLYPTNFPPDPGPFYEYAFTYTNLPAYVEVELGILEPKAVERYRGLTNLVPVQTNYVARQAKRVHLFRQRVPIRSVPVTTPLY